MTSVYFFVVICAAFICTQGQQTMLQGQASSNPFPIVRGRLNSVGLTNLSPYRIIPASRLLRGRPLPYSRISNRLPHSGKSTNMGTPFSRTSGSLYGGYNPEAGIGNGPLSLALASGMPSMTSAKKGVGKPLPTTTSAVPKNMMSMMLPLLMKKGGGGGAGGKNEAMKMFMLMSMMGNKGSGTGGNNMMAMLPMLMGGSGGGGGGGENSNPMMMVMMMMMMMQGGGGGGGAGMAQMLPLIMAMSSGGGESNTNYMLPLLMMSMSGSGQSSPGSWSNGSKPSGVMSSAKIARLMSMLRPANAA